LSIQINVFPTDIDFVLPCHNLHLALACTFRGKKEGKTISFSAKGGENNTMAGSGG